MAPGSTLSMWREIPTGKSAKVSPRALGYDLVGLFNLDSPNLIFIVDILLTSNAVLMAPENTQYLSWLAEKNYGLSFRLLLKTRCKNKPVSLECLVS